MDFIDKFINKFFDSMKKKQTGRVMANIKREQPELAKKLGKIDDAYTDLHNFLETHKNDKEE
jgi:hypothetical protein